MKYLLLIPACLLILTCVLFYAFATQYKWGSRWVTAMFVMAAVISQVGGIWIAGSLDR